MSSSQKMESLRVESPGVIFLGDIYEYRVQLGPCEIRVQQDSFTARQEGIFKEGDICALNIRNLRYYDDVEGVSF